VRGVYGRLKAGVGSCVTSIELTDRQDDASIENFRGKISYEIFPLENSRILHF